MHKIKLDPEALRVESFVADVTEPALRGTVEAHASITYGEPNVCGSDPASQQCLETDYHWYTCGESCINMCLHTGVQAGCVE
jgi:hypothetical protein